MSGRAIHVSDLATQTVARDPRPPLGARIVVCGAAAARPQSFRLDRGSCVVGSAQSADIVIQDRAVSRAHLELAVVSGGIAVRDLGSRNGTYYLGQRVQKITLSHGASVTLGSARLVFEADTDALVDLRFDGTSLRGMLGTSPAMRRLFATISRLDETRVSVLVNGESGVGKELVARALHEGSGVRGPLVCFNCGAVARDLVTSELFGHRRGAFTGATDARRGAFESADGGTLFLDEVGELPLDVQPALLRVLEAGDVRPVGADQTMRVNVRVVAATHRDLEQDVREGRFREDLYYRLAVIKLVVPPLRERVDDISVLAQKFASDMGTSLPPEVLEKLKERDWPGNARELRNVVQAFVVLGALPATPRSKLTPPDTLASMVDLGRPYAALKEELLEQFQRVYLTELLAFTNGNQSAAAKIAGMDRTYLGKLLARYALGGEGAP